MVVEKKVISFEYFCDLCGKQIEGKVYSPVWGELDPDGEVPMWVGDIINVDICSCCVKKADRMIMDLFTDNRQADNESEDKRDLVEVSQELAEDAEPELAQPLAQDKSDIRSVAEELAGMERPKGKGKGRSRKKVEIDVEKARSLREKGWTSKQIAKELNVSIATLHRRLQGM